MNTYKCSVCKEIFGFVREDWSDEKAKEEYHKLFPNSKWENRAIICDDCWQKIKPSSPWYELR